MLAHACLTSVSLCTVLFNSVINVVMAAAVHAEHCVQAGSLPFASTPVIVSPSVVVPAAAAGSGLADSGLVDVSQAASAELTSEMLSSGVPEFLPLALAGITLLWLASWGRRRKLSGKKPAPASASKKAAASSRSSAA